MKKICAIRILNITFLLLVVVFYELSRTFIYIRYWADDFCTAGVLKNYGFFKSLSFWWNNWSGRFSFNFTVNIFELFGEKVVVFLPFLNVILLILSFWLIFRKFFGNLFPILFTFILFLNSPNIIQTFFWQTGLLTYSFPFFFVNLFFYILISNWVTVKPSKITYFYAFILAFVAGGYNETLALTLFVFVSITFLFLWLFKENLRRGLINLIALGLLGLFLSMVLSYFSPGNNIRIINVTKPENAYFVVSSSFHAMFWFFNKLIHTIIFNASLAILLFFVFAKISFSKRILSTRINMTVLILTAISPIVTTFTLFLVSFSLTSYLPPERTQFIAVYFILIEFLIFSFIMTALAGKYLKSQIIEKLNKYRNLICLFFIFVLLIISAYKVSGIRNELKLYASLWDQEEKNIKQQKSEGTGSVKLNYIGSVGKLDGFSENGGWVANCVKDYFGFKSVEVIK